jgi:nitrite reductase (NADH) large subunit
MKSQERLVVVGNGMVGAKVVEEIQARDRHRFRITMFGDEPYGCYNRILLSNVLNGSQAAREIFTNPLEWYDRHGIALHAGVRVERIDRERRVVVGDNGVEEPYDRLILATGSRPFVPSMENLYAAEAVGGEDCPQPSAVSRQPSALSSQPGERCPRSARRSPLSTTLKAGVFLFRTIDDCESIANYATECSRAVVIGGGLLGLEAARGLLAHGVAVTIVEVAPHLMVQQLDSEGGAILRETMEKMGIEVCLERQTKAILGNGHVTGLEFADGSTLEAGMVVVSCGIRANSELARDCGLRTERGIVVDDQMRTADPRVFAVGECAQHRGMVYGLVAPLYEQAQVLADVLTGVSPDSLYLGSRLATKLKVMGVELLSMGRVGDFEPGDEVLSYAERSAGVYKKLIVRDGQLVAGCLLGDTGNAGPLMDLFTRGADLPERRSELLFPSQGGGEADVKNIPNEALICSCHQVPKKTILKAIGDGRCSVSTVAACTKAGTGCGGCKPIVQELLDAYAGNATPDPRDSWYVPGVPFAKPELVRQIRLRGLKSVSAVFRELAGGEEDAASKMGLASLLKSLWNDEYEDERDARFINDRVHANIQNDGTFSVVPRIYGGITTPDELRRIADAAEKYQVRMVKITGGQRIDLLGVKKQDLPAIWRDLGMPSGHAYTKAFRTCKTCVGSEFCRFGVGDSTTLGVALEKRFQGIEFPHKVKLAASGCPRNCAESTVKDIGFVAVDDGWEIYVGGAAGSRVRAGDLLCKLATQEEVMRITGRFMQYYREHGKYLERSPAFVERIGIERLRQILVEDSEGIADRLDAEIQAAVDAYVDPWEERDQPYHPGQFGGDFVPVQELVGAGRQS